MSPRRGFGRCGCPVTMGSRPWLPHAVPLGLNTFRRDIIASSRNAATLHLAATRRQDVAMGVSPWTAAPR